MTDHRIVFDKMKPMLPIFDMEVGDDGYVVMEDSGEYAPVYKDNGPLKPDNIGGFINHPRTGETMLLRDDFSDMCDYTRTREEVGEVTSFLR